MQIRRPTPNPRSPESDDEYELPYLTHGNVGWNDETEARKRPRRLKKNAIGFAAGAPAEIGGRTAGSFPSVPKFDSPPSTSSRRGSGKDGRRPR